VKRLNFPSPQDYQKAKKKQNYSLGLIPKAEQVSFLAEINYLGKMY